MAGRIEHSSQHCLALASGQDSLAPAAIPTLHCRGIGDFNSIQELSPRSHGEV